jgi:hypothetical protein
MKKTFIYIFIFVIQNYYAQKIRFFGELKAGKSGFYQNKLLPFSENLDVVKITNPTSTEIYLLASYYAKSRWHPGLKFGYVSNSFDIEFNGNSSYLENLTVGGYNEKEPNKYEINDRKVNYYLFSIRNEFTVYQSKKLSLNPFFDLGLNLVNKATNSQKKVNASFTAFPEDEYNFYQNFKSHAFLEVGATAETFRKRIGLTFAFKRNLTSVYNEKGIKLSSFLVGIRYNFANFNISKYRYSQQKNSELKINDNSKHFTIGFRLSFPITGKITTTGSEFYKSSDGSGVINVANGNFKLERDFPLLPALNANKKINKYFEVELGLALRSYYMYINIDKITPTSTTRDLVKGSTYLLYSCLDFNSLITAYHKKEHKIQLILGFSSWRDFSSENIGKLKNLSLGIQYKHNRIGFRTNYQRSFNKIKYNPVGDLTLKHFSYLDLSISYDIIKK